MKISNDFFLWKLNRIPHSFWPTGENIQKLSNVKQKDQSIQDWITVMLLVLVGI